MFRFPNRYSGNYTSGGRTTQLRRQTAAGSHGAPLNGNSDMSVGSVVAAQLFCPCPVPAVIPTPPTPPTPSEDLWVARGVAQPTFSATDNADRCVVIGNWTATTADFYDASENLAQTLSAVDETQHGFVVVYNADGTCAWAARLLGERIEMHKVCIDASDNIIVCGYFGDSLTASSITAYAADGVTSLTRTRYRKNIFVARYSPAGAIDWLVDMTIAIPSSNDEMLTLADMQVYPTGEAVLCGSYFSNAGIDVDIFDTPTSSVPTRTIPGGTGNRNLFLTKFTPAGASNFATYVGKSSSSSYPDVLLNAFNLVLDGPLILLTGYGTYSILDIYSGSGVGPPALSRFGNGFPINNAFVIVYNIGATPQWAATARGNNVQLSGGIGFGIASIYTRIAAVGTSRYVYSGPIAAAGTTTFYNGDGSVSPVSVPSNNPSVYIAAISTGGGQIWANRVEGGGGTKPLNMCMCMDATNNTYAIFYQSEPVLAFYDKFNVLVRTNTLVGSDAYALVLVCYNPGGDIQWINQISSASPLDFPIRIMFDTSGDLFVHGSYPLTDLHFYDDTSSLVRTLTHFGNTDAFIAKYTTAGVLKWAAAAGGVKDTLAIWSEPAAAGRTYTVYQYDTSNDFPGANLEVKDATDTVRETRPPTLGSTSLAVAKYPAGGV
jgi:hypothetical protein